MTWTAIVHQGTGGKRVFKTITEVRKAAPGLMAKKTKGSNEAHKYIDVYEGDGALKELLPTYRIQYGGFMETNPNDLIIYKIKITRTTNPMHPECVGWIQDGYWYPKQGKSRKL